MVSILGNYAYNFPIKFKRAYRLKDLLEKVTASKYYLTNNQIDRISNWKAQQKPLENLQKNLLISPTLTARGAGKEHSGMVLIDTELLSQESNDSLPIREKTKKGYKLAKDGDGIDISGRMASHRGTVQKGLAQTLKTNVDVGVVVKDGKE